MKMRNRGARNLGSRSGKETGYNPLWRKIMPNQREIEIVIKPDATVEIDQIGYEGKACHGDVSDIIKALGKEANTKRKQEYFKPQQVRIHQQH